MQRTRITAKVLATVAVAAVSGCVSVDSGPSPAPAAPEASRLANQDVAPQILEGPAREALEAALPPPAAPAAPPAPSPPPDEPSRAPAAAPPTTPPGAPGADLPARIPAAPERIREQLPRIQPPAVPSVPATATVPDVCTLGRSHGGWDPDSRQAQLCREAYGH
ncbi:hypothetical protein [Streptomyces sp. CB03238]|uniref:hypothetical protein n=1 Tax=Streptomyces sp. CB03238 TaxID=1907777 RepID=UPI000A1118D7|nr:hypothetical protein [Streptomyces sp. CB03238]ORT61022.1 hypothetical protein BKD26_07070 [Streptomyces sp. CB03238]